MTFNFKNKSLSLTNQTPLVNKPRKSSSLFAPQNKLDGFYSNLKTPKSNYIIILNNSIFSKNGDSVVVAS